MLFSINEDKTLNFVCLGSATKEELLATGNYIEVEDSLVPNSVYLILTEKGEVVINQAKIDEEKLVELKDLRAFYLNKTDFVVLIDNPLSLTDEEIKEVLLFRKNTREIKTELQTIPACISKLF